ncbi:DUF397 domain-containing protein [Streptomyces sp. NPDC086091]|uniref:DUF397 domain-containing protein n=1 Tax=Streptomyces sp. NPDC086091 TaxID=3365751 RepID=UPI003812D394
MTRVEDSSTLPATWWKSSASAAQSDCVECAVVAPGRIALRDSKAPTGPALLLSRQALDDFVASLKSTAAPTR